MMCRGSGRAIPLFTSYNNYIQLYLTHSHAFHSSLYVHICVTGSRYNIRHFYCLAVEAGFYSDVVECLPVDPATWVRFPAGAGKIFSLYDNGAHRK